ncbi:pericentrin-like [Varanus komodoensis]|uniref:pericentrin-like n=1 Tax=Varanus komodoensis TaxID=61221 RepID=UPI001CF7AF22|nr:pericentrin-like [Varanus komodoensis]
MDNFRDMDKILWDSPENMRKQNNSMELQVRDAEGFILMSPELQDDLKSTMSRLENACTEYGSNTSSDLVLQLNWKKPETTIYQDGNVMAYLQHSGIFPDVTEPGMKEKDFFSQQLKNVLSMVYEESYKILVLSEKPLPIENDKNVQQAPSEVKWQREKQTLLDIVQSLKDYLNKISHKEKQENSSFFDWRGKLLQAVECILEKEQNTLQGYLQSHFHNSGSGDTGALVKKLEYIVEQQEHQQTLVLEHLLSSDRNSLLAEIQDLKAQLRLTHLQNQEKLQQLQETLIDTENHGSKQEHQLRRQVELLEYKLQEEKLIASNLQDSLQSEQDKASKIHELLKEEHTAIVNLKSELCESKQTNEKLEKALEELQKEVIKYRSALEMKEKGITAVFQDLQNEQQELQTMLDERQHQHKIREDESSRAIEELQAALELQCIQNNQLSVALEHQQSANIDLQTEQSRCEALLCQYQNKLLQLQKNIDAEKNHSLELLSALSHDHDLTEQLNMKMNECESCKHKNVLPNLQAQLYIERSYARELLAAIERTQQQELNSKKQMDGMQRYCEETQKEENYTSLQVSQATLQNLKQDIIHGLNIHKKKETQMKEEWEQLHPILKALRDQGNRTRQGIRGRKYEQQVDCDKLKELQKSQETQAIPAYIINSLQESEGITRLKEKSVLQAADLKAAENDTRNTDRTVGKKSTMASSNLKMQKLYRKYLRAESFRKALVYQKKYLLLLLGGFQECEQATLSLIARMGIYPSPTSLNVSEARSQSFTRFRSAVRVVIAISRLKFLIRKWHKVGRKEVSSEANSPTVACSTCENF